ncbi:MAG: hypothetical protein JXX28_01795 [Deltaproteobacteria bacterium]|nr:hypothetical protein [Deltaproteobacteria bacterium]
MKKPLKSAPSPPEEPSAPRARWVEEPTPSTKRRGLAPPDMVLAEGVKPRRDTDADRRRAVMALDDWGLGHTGLTPGQD